MTSHPRWFYQVIAGCAIVASLSFAVRMLNPPATWEHTSPESAFNRATGEQCWIFDRRLVCVDFRSGKMRRQLLGSAPDSILPDTVDPFRDLVPKKP